VAAPDRVVVKDAGLVPGHRRRPQVVGVKPDLNSSCADGENLKQSNLVTVTTVEKGSER
jgi:hypothetical protein